ncbi:P43 5S RNA-binding protein-like [Ambystoma mexicanum]|uniref:P43 5S RNA-binding protein-like n=1 Tax=Ambystoma mexicanum TaxID=8296 RepID=UPI0037E7014D
MQAQGPAAPAGATPSKKIPCPVKECGASFKKAWRLKEHVCTHTGEKPLRCDQPDCGKCFTRNDHLRQHRAKHMAQKPFRCPEGDCKAAFVTAGQLQKHRSRHGLKLKCTLAGCPKTFSKKRALKTHLLEHGGGGASFECQRPGCGMKFDSSAKRKAHHRKHAAYPCPIDDCKTVTTTWTGRMKHLKTHPVEYNCLLCGKVFKKQNSLRRHGLSHVPKKPVLLCPREDCKAFFTTDYNLEHHIKKDHLHILKYHCYFPGCEKAFAMRASLTRHLVVHDPDRKKLQLKPPRVKRSWKRRWQSRCSELPLVEGNLSRLFNHKLSFRFKTKVESDLSGLFNERKLRPTAAAEVNLENLFYLPSGRKAEKAV